jgi:hypothetical protein
MAFDWQFLVVTLAALWGGWALLRPLLRLRAARKEGAACAHCAAGNPCEPAETVDTAARPATASSGLVSIGSGRKAASQARH